MKLTGVIAAVGLSALMSVVALGPGCGVGDSGHMGTVKGAVGAGGMQQGGSAGSSDESGCDEGAMGGMHGGCGGEGGMMSGQGGMMGGDGADEQAGGTPGAQEHDCPMMKGGGEQGSHNHGDMHGEGGMGSMHDDQGEDPDGDPHAHCGMMGGGSEESDDPMMGNKGDEDAAGGCPMMDGMHD